MTKVLTEAIHKVSSLPEADQEVIARELLLRVDKLNQLRAKLDEGIRELDAGLGKELDVGDIISRARAAFRRRRLAGRVWQ